MYTKEYKNGVTTIHFDKIYPVKQIIFNESIQDISWSIDKDEAHQTKLKIEGNCVRFNQVHLRNLKIVGDVSIKEVIYDEGYIVEEAKELNKIFLRKCGWSGADGVYQHQIGDKIHWYFSDTFVGEVNDKTWMRKDGFKMVNNTLGISTVDKPFDIDFLVKETNGEVDTYFKPNDEGHYWLQDGIYLDGQFYLTVIRVVSGNPFAVVGVDTLKIPYKNPQLQVEDYKRVASNFYLNDGNRLYTFGAAILDDRENSGYIYVFGYDDTKNRNCVVSRVKEHIINQEYEYLTEHGWSKKAEHLKNLVEHVSCEFKVIYDGSDYLISYTKGSIGKQIMIGKTKRLEDGFKNFTCVYECPEMNKKDTLITYNAKLQVFSSLEDYYISYHVNTSIDEEHQDATIYYPRWIKLKRRGG